MIIDSIQNGIVIDHITAGKSMELYQILGLDQLDCTVAILKNVTSGKLGCKDIIKIDREMDLDWDLIGYVDPSITVNIIRDGKLVEKRTLKLPERIRGVLKCKNPRCITSVEQELPQEFVLTDREKRVYRCRYCETQAGKEAFVRQKSRRSCLQRSMQNQTSLDAQGASSQHAVLSGRKAEGFRCTMEDARHIITIERIFGYPLLQRCRNNESSLSIRTWR